MQYGQIKYVSKPVSRLVFGTSYRAIMDICPPVFAPKEGREERREAGLQLLDALLAAGVNTFDCAAMYGEEALGDWMVSRNNREQVVVLSKCGHHNQWRKRVTEYDIQSDLHDSLCKLRTDHIDIYILHRDDPSVPVGPIVELFNRLHREGLIGAFGASNWTHERIAEANRYAETHGLIPFTVASPNFSLAEQIADPWGGGCVSISGPSNTAAREWYAGQRMPVFAYSGMARGLFSGRFRSDDPEGAAQLMDPPSRKGYCCPENFRRLARAEQLAAEKGVEIAQIALAWLVNQPLEVYPVCSFSAAHMSSTIQALDLPLTAQECAWLDLRTDER